MAVVHLKDSRSKSDAATPCASSGCCRSIPAVWSNFKDTQRSVPDGCWDFVANEDDDAGIILNLTRTERLLGLAIAMTVALAV